MKKVSLILVLIVALVALVGCGSSKETLDVFGPSVYIDDENLKKFEEENNVRVRYETFASNEEMYTKLQGGDKFDILIPSDYMIERLIEEEAILPLDLSKITNYDGIIDGLKVLEFDAGNKYHIPYFWGTVGITYNTKNVDIKDLEEQGWNILNNVKYKSRVLIYNSERDAFMTALKALGYSANSTNENELQKAYDWLVKQKQTMDPVYVQDEVINSMKSGSRDLAIMYSGDATDVISENEDMDFFMPNEGTNVWVDGMVISKDAKNVELATKWINFMINEEQAELNALEVGYTPVVQATFDKLQDGEFEGIHSFVPRLGYEKDETFRHNEALRKKISELWERVILQ